MTLTLSVPGIPVITADGLTDATGVVRVLDDDSARGDTWLGPATALVTTTDVRDGHRPDRSSRSSSSSRGLPGSPMRASTRIGGSYHSGDGDVALPTLQHSPAGGRSVLGLQTVEHDLLDLPALPPLGRGAARLLRPRPSPEPAHRLRDSIVLGVRDRRRCPTSRQRPARSIRSSGDSRTPVRLGRDFVPVETGPDPVEPPQPIA